MNQQKYLVQQVDWSTTIVRVKKKNEPVNNGFGPVELKSSAEYLVKMLAGLGGPHDDVKSLCAENKVSSFDPQPSIDSPNLVGEKYGLFFVRS